MEENINRKEEPPVPAAEGAPTGKAEDAAAVQPGLIPTEDEFEEPIIVEKPSSSGPGEGQSKALTKSIGLGLPSDRFRAVLPRGSFPPLTGRQQFIARLRDKDRVSFRIFEGDEDLASQNEFLAEIGMVGVALNNEDKAFLEVDFHLNLEKMLTVRLMDKFGEKEAIVILDMAQRPKVSITQDKASEITTKLNDIDKRIAALEGLIGNLAKR